MVSFSTSSEALENETNDHAMGAKADRIWASSPLNNGERILAIHENARA
jgi:hypothetical protein